MIKTVIKKSEEPSGRDALNIFNKIIMSLTEYGEGFIDVENKVYYTKINIKVGERAFDLLHKDLMQLNEKVNMDCLDYAGVSFSIEKNGRP